MAVLSKTGLIDYCLRNLGFPVIPVNVSEEQIEDRVEEALEYFREYHYDGIEKVYLKHQLTQQNIDDKEIQLNDSLIYGVTRVHRYTGVASTNNMFSLEYQIRLEDIYNLLEADLINYELTQQHLTLLDRLLIGEHPFRFNRIKNIIYLDQDMSRTFKEGDYILVECYRVLDPADLPNVWGNQWLRKYTTALIKRQWATNVKFYSGMQLPGGITIDGDGLYQEAVSELAELEDQLENRSTPLFFEVG